MNVSRRAIIRHAIALNLVIVATGVAMLAGNSAAAILASFLVAVALSAWFGLEEVGLVATGYSVVILGLNFGSVIDVTALTVFAATGAVLSSIIRAVRRLPQARAAEPLPGALGARLAPTRPFALGLPLLVLTVYTDISDAVMRVYHVPSLLQPVIALLAVVVWKNRRILRPGEATVNPTVVLLTLWSVLVFSTSIWATEKAPADAFVGELLKSLFICLLVASLAFSWNTLRLAMTALVAAASAFSAISIIQVSTGRLPDALWGLVTLRTGTIFGETELPRAAGPPVHDPNFYARILLLALPLAIALAAAQRKRAARLAYFAAAALITAGVLATYSRGAMLALAAVAVLLIAVLRIPLKVSVSAAVLVILLIPFLPANIGKRFTTLETVAPGGSFQDSSVEMRRLWGRSALKMFEAHPLIGVGGGQFGVHYEEYSNLAGSTAYDYEPPGTEKFPHSLFLQIAAETGLAGLAAFAALIGAAMASALKSRRTLLNRGEHGHAMIAASLAITLGGYLVASLFLHETYFRYMALILGFICAVGRLARTGVAEEVAAGREKVPTWSELWSAPQLAAPPLAGEAPQH